MSGVPRSRFLRLTALRNGPHLTHRVCQNDRPPGQLWRAGRFPSEYRNMRAFTLSGGGWGIPEKKRSPRRSFRTRAPGAHRISHRRVHGCLRPFRGEPGEENYAVRLWQRPRSPGAKRRQGRPVPRHGKKSGRRSRSRRPRSPGAKRRARTTLAGGNSQQRLPALALRDTPAPRRTASTQHLPLEPNQDPNQDPQPLDPSPLDPIRSKRMKPTPQTSHQHAQSR